MENLSDTDLVRLSLTGDANAFEHLVRRHYLMVYRVSYKWCGVKEDAEDIAQDVFVKVAQKLDRFLGKSAFRTWLYRVTLNTAKDFVRMRTVKSAHENAYARELVAGNPGRNPADPTAGETLALALDRLPERQKAAVLLVLAEGLTHKEAARVLNCSETTVSWRIFQARKRLKTSLRLET